MPFIGLEMPAGMFRNGTAFQAAGRWRDGSLVRWRDGVMRPIKGWTTRATVSGSPNPPRGAVAWRDNGGDPNLLFGTSNALWHMDIQGNLTNVTPTGLSAGRVNAVANTGFGGGFFGNATFGDPRPAGTTTLPATTWSLAPWGEDVIACSTFDRRLFLFDASVGTAATVLSNAPINNNAVVVTSERFVMALGAGADPRKVQWSDQEQNNVWAPAATNQAGSITLTTPGTLMAGLQTRGEVLLLSDHDAHTARYVGPPFVYGFERVGVACGLIAPLAATAVDQGVFWMGQGGFFLYSGGSVQSIPCEVRDYVFGDINTAQISKVVAVSNSSNGEVWWFYPAEASNECDRYVAFNYEEGHWMTGTMPRTSGVDRGAFPNPLWISPSAVVYNHEVGYTHGTDSPFVVSGPVSLGMGEVVMSAVSLIPDEKTQGDVNMTFTTRFQPNNTQRSYGPYTMKNPTSVRFTGRQVELRIDGVTNSDWRVGIPRLDVRPGGER